MVASSLGSRGWTVENKGRQGRWIKGGGLRQRRAYNWRNIMKELVFRESESDRKRIYWFAEPVWENAVFLPLTAQFCQFLLIQRDVAMMLAARWCTCQELFRPTRQTAERKSNTSSDIPISALSLRGSTLCGTWHVKFHTYYYGALLLSWVSMHYMLCKMVFQWWSTLQVLYSWGCQFLSIWPKPWIAVRYLNKCLNKGLTRDTKTTKQ